MDKYQDFVDKHTYKYLVKLLTRTKGNISQALKVSGIARTVFWRMMKHHRILIQEAPAFGDSPVKLEGYTIIWRPRGLKRPRR